MSVPEPNEDVDYYIDELRRYTVTIEVAVDGLKEDEEADICSKAVDIFREGSIDGDATIVYSEKIRDVELDFKTDLPFNRAEWQKAKCAEMGLNEGGEPLRPHEKERSKSEKRLEDFTT
jgi:hypothetical protein